MIPVYLFQLFLIKIASFMSLAQAVCFYFGRNNIRGWVCISNPRNVFAQPVLYPQQVYLRIVESLILRGSNGCSGRNSVWMTNRAALFARSIQCLSSPVMLMMTLMNPYIDSYMAVIPTDRGSTFTKMVFRMLFIFLWEWDFVWWVEIICVPRFVSE